MIFKHDVASNASFEVLFRDNNYPRLGDWQHVCKEVDQTCKNVIYFVPGIPLSVIYILVNKLFQKMGIEVMGVKMNMLREGGSWGGDIWLKDELKKNFKVPLGDNTSTDNLCIHTQEVCHPREWAHIVNDVNDELTKNGVVPIIMGDMGIWFNVLYPLYKKEFEKRGNKIIRIRIQIGETVKKWDKKFIDRFDNGEIDCLGQEF